MTSWTWLSVIPAFVISTNCVSLCISSIDLHPTFCIRSKPFRDLGLRYGNLPDKEFVKSNIYNMLGKEVRILFNKVQEAGLKTINWNGLDKNNKKLPSGLYLYSLQSGSFRETKKMIFLK